MNKWVTRTRAAYHRNDLHGMTVYGFGSFDDQFYEGIVWISPGGRLAPEILYLDIVETLIIQVYSKLVKYLQRVLVRHQAEIYLGGGTRWEDGFRAGSLVAGCQPAYRAGGLKDLRDA